MKKIVLTVLIVLSMLAPAMVFSRSASATTCPVKMPETLLSLYRNSDAIYIGSYRGSEEGKVTRDEDEYTVVEIKKHFDISTALKGQPLKSFTKIDNDYRYKGKNAGFETLEEVQEAQVVPETTIEEFEDMEEDVPVELKPGDDVLLFLRNDEESKRLELTDYRDGLKNLPVADIAVYEARIKELNSIFIAEEPDVERIVEWLVRCAEDAATRWEGTYELEQSFNALDYKSQRDAERKEKIANGEDPGNDDYYLDDGLDTGRTTIFARSLNEYQKQTLANILLNSEFQAAPKRPGQAGSVRGDSELIRLVSRWADGRIAALLLSRLRGGSFSAWENSEMMETIASILDDEQVTAIAEKFSDIYYEGDDSEVDESDTDETEETASGDEETVGTEAIETVTPTSESSEDETAEQKIEETNEAKTAKKPAMTYKQLRENLMSKFLLRADEVMANPDARVRAGK